jgi:hypothetical protein
MTATFQVNSSAYVRTPMGIFAVAYFALDGFFEFIN